MSAMCGCDVAMVQTRLHLANLPLAKRHNGRIVSCHKGNKFVYCISDNVICCVSVGWEYRDKVDLDDSVCFFRNDDGDYEYLPV